MGTWSISPSNSGATINSASGKISFSQNTSTNDRTFTVTYNDGSGNTATQTITQIGKPS